MDEAVLEAEPVDERLERRARRAQRLRHVDLAGAASVEIIGRGDAGAAPRRSRDRPRGSRPRCPGRARGRARAPSSSRLFCSGRIDGEAVQRRGRARRRPPRRRRAAPASASACVPSGTGSCLAPRDLVEPESRRRRRRGRARGRARRARPRPSGRAGAAPAIAAARPAAPPRRASGGAAPCRNRRATRRARLRDCRHRARGVR